MRLPKIIKFSFEKRYDVKKIDDNRGESPQGCQESLSEETLEQWQTSIGCSEGKAFGRSNSICKGLGAGVDSVSSEHLLGVAGDQQAGA